MYWIIRDDYNMTLKKVCFYQKEM